MHAPNESTAGPHSGQPVLMTGEPLNSARAAMILLHGRGATAQDILTLVDEIEQPGFTYLAPQAASGSWYPNRFLDLTSSNQPWLASALAVVDKLLEHLQRSAVGPERTILLGFSQGGCLALEYAARNARRYGGVVGLSAGVIGADEEARQDRGFLEGTPIFLGCSDRDPHIPKERVERSEEILKSLGGKVTLRIYPNMAHTVNRDELDFIRQMSEMLFSS